MPKNAYYIDRPGFEGVEFDSWEEAAKAIDRVDKKDVPPSPIEADKIAKYQAGDSALSEYDRTSTGEARARNRSALDYVAQMKPQTKAEQDTYIPDRSVDINKLATGEVLQEMKERGDESSLVDSPASNLALARKVGLPKYEEFNPGVASVMKDLRGQQVTKTPGVFGGKERYDTQENRDKNEFSIAALVEEKKLSEMDANILRNANQGAGVYDVAQKLASASLGVSTDVRKENELRQPKVQTAAEIERARKMAESSAETETNENAIPGFRPIAGAKITDDSVVKIKNAIPDIQVMQEAVQELIDKYNKMGVRITGEDAADYASKVRNLQLLAKGTPLYNLGVLAGPDLMLLEQTIPNPSDIKAGAATAIYGPMTTRLKNFQNTLNSKSNHFYTANGFEPIPEGDEPEEPKKEMPVGAVPKKEKKSTTRDYGKEYGF